MAQEELRTEKRVTTLQKPNEPRKFRVIILNDDFTTFEFVIDVMMEVFHKTYQEAMEIAETTHMHKKATAGIYSYDIARSKVSKAVSLARAEGFPLNFEIEPE